MVSPEMGLLGVPGDAARCLHLGAKPKSSVTVIV